MAPCLCDKTWNDCEWPGVGTRFFRMKVGQVVVTEGRATSPYSNLIAWATGSWWTHTFMVTGPDELTEARFPRVRTFKLSERIKQLHREDRAYYVLDRPGITVAERCRLVRTMRGYVGRYYDIGQVLLYAVLRRFVQDGSGTMVCSRAISAAFQDALGLQLFGDLSKVDPGSTRIEDLAKGECTPADLLKSSELSVVRFRRSTRIR